MNTAPKSQHDHNPTLDRVRALITLMFQCLGDPTRHLDLERLFAEAEQLLARLTFEAAARIAGRLDLLETHEAYLVSNSRTFDIRVRLKASALHPHHQIILKHRRAARMAQYRRAMGRRSRFSRKLTYLYFRNQRRSYGVRLARASESAASPTHTPSRINAPP